MLKQGKFWKVLKATALPKVMKNLKKSWNLKSLKEYKHCQYSVHDEYVWSHTPLLIGKQEERIKSQTGRHKAWSKVLSLWIQNENYWMNNTFLWNCLLYDTSLTMTLNKILQCDYPRGGLGISRDGDDLMRAKIKTPKISRTSNNPPPQSVKFSSLKNSQKVLKTRKEIPLIFPTQLNPGIKNFKLKKILRSSLSLEIQSTPTVVTIQANSF